MSSSPLEREDIQALHSLETSTEILTCTFKQLIELLIAFINAELKNGNYWRTDDVSETTQLQANIFLAEATLFCNQQILPSKLKSLRVEAWKVHDQLTNGSADKNLIRLLICCLYDEESAEFETYGLEMFLETIVTSLLDTGQGYANKFADYAIKVMPKRI
jgi:hypothetical protein